MHLGRAVLPRLKPISIVLPTFKRTKNHSASPYSLDCASGLLYHMNVLLGGRITLKIYELILGGLNREETLKLLNTRRLPYLKLPASMKLVITKLLR